MVHDLGPKAAEGAPIPTRTPSHAPRTFGLKVRFPVSGQRAGRRKDHQRRGRSRVSATRRPTGFPRAAVIRFTISEVLQACVGGFRWATDGRNPNSSTISDSSKKWRMTSSRWSPHLSPETFWKVGGSTPGQGQASSSPTWTTQWTGIRHSQLENPLKSRRESLRLSVSQLPCARPIATIPIPLA